MDMEEFYKKRNKMAEVVSGLYSSLKLAELNPRNRAVKSDSSGYCIWSVYTDYFRFEVAYYVEKDLCLADFFYNQDADVLRSDCVDFDDIEEVIYEGLAKVLEMVKSEV